MPVTYSISARTVQSRQDRKCDGKLRMRNNDRYS